LGWKSVTLIAAIITVFVKEEWNHKVCFVSLKAINMLEIAYDKVIFGFLYRFQNYYMHTEFEVKIIDYSKEKVQAFLEEHWAQLIHSSFLMKRNNFEVVPKTAGKWIRLRQEFGKCTLTYKSQHNATDPNMMKELEIFVDDFDITKELLEAAGLHSFVYEENYREKWLLDYNWHKIEFCFDQWPGIDEYLEIESDNEETLKQLCKDLDLDYEHWVFGSAFSVYEYHGFDRQKLRAQGNITFQNIPNK
jgi:adenylate cyclase class 2